MRLIDLVERCAAQMDHAHLSFGHGTDNAFDEAVWLVLWRLGLPLDDLDGVAERELDEAEQHQVLDLVQRRISTRKPAAYLTGEAWLQGLPFHVDERVIVPRSLIAEVLCDASLQAFLPRPGASACASAGLRVLDLCTGNGSLAVIAALTLNGATVDATDLSADALAVAQANVARHGLAPRIRLRQGDLLSAAAGVYDLILCNPPYVHRASMQALPEEYRAEPAIALHGGEDGMDLVRPLLRDAAAHLVEDGLLLLEIGNERANFEAAFPHLNPLWLSTSAGDDQVLLLRREDLL